MEPVRLFSASSSPVTRPCLSVTPCQSDNGASVSQFALLFQSGPPVAMYSATRAAYWRSGAAGTVTTSAVLLSSSIAAVISVVPSARPDTRPSASTTPMFGSDDDHVNAASATRMPRASVACAVSCRELPTARVCINAESVGDDILIDTGTCATSTIAESLSVPEVALIWAAPLPLAVTRPLAPTAAIAGAEDDQLTGTPPMDWPMLSNTATMMVEVSPSALKLKLEGATRISVPPRTETVTLTVWVASRPSGSVAVTVMVAVPAATPVMVTVPPDTDTSAMAALEVVAR